MSQTSGLPHVTLWLAVSNTLFRIISGTTDWKVGITRMDAHIWIQVRPTGSNLLIMPVLTEAIVTPDIATCPLTDRAQSKGLYVSDARPSLYARLVTSAKSGLIFLVVKEATAHRALSPLPPVKTTISDQIKFNAKSQSVITCAPLGSVFV